MLPQAARLLREFSFISYARLDDVMVSYAAPGGGVGPHLDSYDVFLVQGTGERRWGVGRQNDTELIAGAPLEILRHFASRQEWRLRPGDLLYVPPRWAHDGVAIGECITYSVGFRAPAAQELATRFLDYLQDQLALDGLYSDPALRPTRNPAHIDASMMVQLATMLKSVRWSTQDIRSFIGCYLSEPKAQVVFTRPRAPLARAAFKRRARERGLALALPTRMLYHEGQLFVNGEAHAIATRGHSPFHTLADERALESPLRMPAASRQLLYEWYLAGYILIGV
jgi:50S ribosomal protein L16 3-hydroxylase